MPEALAERCDVIEETYEFMLAYAAQGVTGDDGSGKGGQIRHFMERAANALSGLSAAYAAAVGDSEVYRAFLAVLDRDAQDSLAAIQLVLAQPAISSQLIDNLNASIHLRALLTDLFLIDEILKLQRSSPEQAGA
ncbi:MAG TPA: hypothetical protein VE958_08310 [Bryobacteraceae bacterium]|jgi:hypothetical protein|nr:hypothetical protein [Bryobacteraceae bacterium]